MAKERLKFNTRVTKEEGNVNLTISDWFAMVLSPEDAWDLGAALMMASEKRHKA